MTAGKNEDEDQSEIQQRWSKLNEDAECGEEQVAALKEDAETYKVLSGVITDTYKHHFGRVSFLDLNTKSSLESTKKELVKSFKP